MRLPGALTMVIVLIFYHRPDKNLSVELSWIIRDPLTKVFTDIIVFITAHRAWIGHAHWYTKSFLCTFLKLSHLLYKINKKKAHQSAQVFIGAIFRQGSACYHA